MQVTQVTLGWLTLGLLQAFLATMGLMTLETLAAEVS